ncbi:uncharacterized protein K02A2.6-like [Rhopalosiphum maidis]|uniref:uncharacterized protein K02A2.6-like n=1 Tax=Rhopalosiphum maidis TaxID=43146 RepID=UPI000EFDC0DE|nr:uncharacterized protein K02A2.6-like [Rhopalosiphum maidis]
MSNCWSLRNEIVASDGLLYFKNKLIVARELKQFIMSLLHETHIVITKTVKRAKTYNYWPGLNSDIENYIIKFELCARFQRKQSKELLLNHKIPKRAFEKVDIDIPDFGGVSYLILVDYYSRWLAVVEISDKTAETIVSVLKTLFSRFGIPKECMSNNVTFNSLTFKKFAQEWDFKIITSSPNYPQSNDMAEKGVGIFKTMMRKCEQTDQDTIVQKMVRSLEEPLNTLKIIIQ